MDMWMGWAHWDGVKGVRVRMADRAVVPSMYKAAPCGVVFLLHVLLPFLALTCSG